MLALLRAAVIRLGQHCRKASIVTQLLSVLTLCSATPLAHAADNFIKMIRMPESLGQSAFVLSAADPFETERIINDKTNEVQLTIRGPDMGDALKRFFANGLVYGENACIDSVTVRELSKSESQVSFRFAQGLQPGVELKHSEVDANYYLAVYLTPQRFVSGMCTALGSGKKKELKWRERPIFFSGNVMLDGGNAVDTQGSLTEDAIGFDEHWELRQLRIEANGVHLNWRYQFRFDFKDAFEDEEIKLNRAYIGYLGWQRLELRVGLLYEPFGLESSTSSKYTTFMERAPLGNIMLESNLGLTASYQPNKTLYLQLGLFRDRPLSDSNKTDSAITGRISYTPIHKKRKLLHLGASFSRREPVDNEARYRVRPEAHLANRIFRTRTLRDIDHIRLTGVEAALVMGPLSLQAESMQALHQFNDDKADHTVRSHYLMASWFITGESRRYSRGVFGSIRPKNPIGHGWGAWELALRYSTIDEGRDRTLEDQTLGINWYLNKRTRFMFNWVHTRYEKATTVGEADIAQIRAQYRF